MAKILKASAFPSRAHLDAHIQTLKKPFEYTIQGTGSELARLRLSSTTTVFGARCVETDKVFSTIGRNTADRGKRFISGINLPVEKRNKLLDKAEKNVKPSNKNTHRAKSTRSSTKRG